MTALHQSARSRGTLFFETPVCTGPPSYGGVLKSSYLITGSVFVVTLLIVAVPVLLGILPLSAFVGVLITTFVTFILMLAVTKRKRRDYVAVVIAAWKFNKEERNVIS